MLQLLLISFLKSFLDFSKYSSGKIDRDIEDKVSEELKEKIIKTL